MTAPEPTRPAAEHIDAVARAMRQHPESGGRNMSDIAREVYAERLLTSTDSAVHEALAANLPADVMLDALVRAGVLTAGQAKFGALPIRPGDSFSGRAG